MVNSNTCHLRCSVGFSFEILKHHLWNNKVPESFNHTEITMNDVVATDIYPLTVEEYETAEVVAADVEVE